MRGTGGHLGVKSANGRFLVGCQRRISDDQEVDVRVDVSRAKGEGPCQVHTNQIRAERATNPARQVTQEITQLGGLVRGKLIVEFAQNDGATIDKAARLPDRPCPSDASSTMASTLPHGYPAAHDIRGEILFGNPRIAGDALRDQAEERLRRGGA